MFTIEDGQWTASEEGSPQGASVSPLLANIYSLDFCTSFELGGGDRSRRRWDVIVT